MSIYSIAGQIGSGKSFFQLKLALEMANLKEKQLVTNFPLNREALEIYCKKVGYKWVLDLLKYGGITEIHAPKDLQTLLLVQSVVCLDEAGILLNARSWKDTPRAFLSDLCQSRKQGTDLIWAAQFPEQVDSQMRMLTQFWIHASGLTYYDKISRLPKLYYKRYYFMDANTHNKWVSKHVGHLKTRIFFSYRYHGGFLNPTDGLLFNCFDTTTRLDRSNDGYAKRESLDYCKISDRPHYSKSFTEYNSGIRQDFLIVSNHDRANSVLQKHIDAFDEAWYSEYVQRCSTADNEYVQSDEYQQQLVSQV